MEPTDALMIDAALYGGFFLLSNFISYVDAKHRLAYSGHGGSGVIKAIREQRDMYKSIPRRITNAIMEQPGELLAIRLHRK